VLHGAGQGDRPAQQRLAGRPVALGDQAHALEQVAEELAGLVGDGHGGGPAAELGRRGHVAGVAGDLSRLDQHGQGLAGVDGGGQLGGGDQHGHGVQGGPAACLDRPAQVGDVGLAARVGGQRLGPIGEGGGPFGLAGQPGPGSRPRPAGGRARGRRR
jgi:hypothetical protein